MKNLPQLKQTITFFPRKHFILLGGLLFLLSVAVFGFSPKNHSRDLVNLDLANNVLSHENQDALDATAPLSVIEPETPVKTLNWKKEEIRSGDSLATIFNRVGASTNDLYRFINSNDAAQQLKRIFPGQTLQFGFDSEQQLQELTYQLSKLEQMHFVRGEDNQYSVEHLISEPEISVVYRNAEINGSLFLAAQKAGIPQNLTMQLADIFSGVIDFVYDPRKGDSFDLLYEEKYLNGEKIGTGNLLAATYNGSKQSFTAYRYQAADGKVGYYNEDGVSMRKAFLRAPLDFTRISSNFNPGRLHPVLNTMRAHRGTDYAAPTGTPVYAAGDGRVTHAGYNNANGNYVFIAHGSQYVTKYLHLSKRNVKVGQQVSQRQIIGAVGATGYATGPHLHYEFLVNGVHKDPRTILNRLPSAEPIAKQEMAAFEEQTHALRLMYQNQQQMLAKSD